MTKFNIALAIFVIAAAGSVWAAPERFCNVGDNIDDAGGCQGGETCCDMRDAGGVLKPGLSEMSKGKNGACCSTENEFCPMFELGFVDCVPSGPLPVRYCDNPFEADTGGCENDEGCCPIDEFGKNTPDGIVAVDNPLIARFTNNVNNKPGACCKGGCIDIEKGEVRCRTK